MYRCFTGTSPGPNICASSDGATGTASVGGSLVSALLLVCCCAVCCCGGRFKIPNPTRAYDADASHYVPMGVAVPPMAAAAAPPPYAPPMQGTIPFGPGYPPPSYSLWPGQALPMAGPPHGRQEPPVAGGGAASMFASAAAGLLGGVLVDEVIHAGGGHQGGQPQGDGGDGFVADM